MLDSSGRRSAELAARVFRGGLYLNQWAYGKIAGHSMQRQYWITLRGIPACRQLILVARLLTWAKAGSRVDASLLAAQRKIIK